MATLPLVATPINPLSSAPKDLARQHWRERLMRGYFAIKSLCLRLNLPVEGLFFDRCMAEYTRAYRLAPKGSSARNVELLSSVVVYRQSLGVSIPVPKSTLIEFLGGPKAVAAFHRVLASTSKNAPRQDPRTIASRLVGTILEGVAAPTEVVEAASRILAVGLDVFLVTKPHVVAAAIVAASVLASGQAGKVRLTHIAACARVAPSAVDRCLITTAARLGKKLPDVPSHCGSIFQELFAVGFAKPST